MGLSQEKIIVGVIAILIMSTIFSFLGVYDSNTMPLSQRLFFWGSTMSTGAATGLLFLQWVLEGPLAKKSILLKLIAISAIACAPVVIVLAAFSGGLTGGWPLYNWPLQYGMSFFIAIIVNAIGYVTLKAAGWIPSSNGSPIDDHASSSSQFLKRLPPKYLNADLYAISSEDHYVRVHTSCGEELILMRLGDALKELSRANGLQTHRSWWVAQAGIANTIAKNGKHSIVLKTGTVAPVSRSYSKAVRKAYFN